MMQNFVQELSNLSPEEAERWVMQQAMFAPPPVMPPRGQGASPAQGQPPAQAQPTQMPAVNFANTVNPGAPPMQPNAPGLAQNSPQLPNTAQGVSAATTPLNQILGA